MKKTLAIMLALIMVLALVPTVAFAAGNTIYVDAKNGNDDQEGVGTTREKAYKSLDKAMDVAGQEATIYLAEGTYCGNSAKPSEEGKGAGKNLTFVGAGSDKTKWQIRATKKYGSDGWCDYSFKNSDNITFENMTVIGSVYSDNSIKNNDTQGLTYINHLTLKDCIFNGRADYWGYKTTTFEDVTFNAPGTEASEIEDVDYSLWTWTGTEYTFNNCTFNSAGKVINVYHGDGKRATTINFNNCTVNSTNSESLSVMNINDALVQSFTINFNGKNTINGIKADGIQVTGGSHASAAKDTANGKKTSAQATCSKLFEFNMKYGNGNNGKTTVNIDNTPVWTGGRMLRHAIDTTYDKYTDGYKDNAFEITPVTTVGYLKTCKYCGYTEPFYGELSNEIELTRTVNVTQNSNSVHEDAANPNKYKVENSSNITVDYTATMDMENLKWLVAGKDVDVSTITGNTASSPWELLKTLAAAGRIDSQTEVILNFNFDDKIDLAAFKAKYEAAVTAGTSANVLNLTSDMFEIAADGVAFDTPNHKMTITCNWKDEAKTDDPKITLYGYGLPVKNNWNGSTTIDIANKGCVSGTVSISSKPLIAKVEVNNTLVNNDSSEKFPTIQIPIVGGCKTDEFTLYYGGGSSGDSGHSYYYPTTTPVPVIVIPPKTGDMTIWQSILHFLGIR